MTACQCGEPNQMDEQFQELEKSFAKYKNVPGALIPLLQEAQDIFGYLPGEVLRTISRELGVPLSKTYGVTTFYAQFHLNPRGRNIIKMCQGTACHVRGAAKVFDAVSTELGVAGNETTEDLRYTLETVACIGACGLAPVMMVNEDTHGKLSPDKAVSVLKNYE